MMGNKEQALSDRIWQDRDVLFDLETRMLHPCAGEHTIERIDNVEDTKGNNGDRGILRITNLRLVWRTVLIPRINLSIGYNAITGITTRIAKSKIRGTAESLYVLAKGLSGTKFEFIFTCINPFYTKLFSTVIGMHRAYETSKMYREMKMRTALVDDDDRVRLLPQEQKLDSFDGVWNLSGDQGNLGGIVITNVRVVWFASLNPQYNVSIPYMQMRSCRIRESRFGRALVIETSVQSGEYVLGFQIKPDERLQMACKSIQALHNGFLSAPIFGVQYTKKDLGQDGGALMGFGYCAEHDGGPSKAGSALLDAVEAVDIDEEEANKKGGAVGGGNGGVGANDNASKPLRIDAFAAYFSDGMMPPRQHDPSANDEQGTDKRHQQQQQQARKQIVYSDELGVAIEQMKAGFTIKDLWEIRVD